MRVSAGSRQPAVPRASPQPRREVHSGCLMKGLLRLISASGGGLLCEPARFERYVAHYAGIVGSGFKHSHMIHTGAARRLCQGKLPAFPPRPGAPSAEGSSRSQDLPVIAFYRKEDTFSLDQFIS